MNRFLTLTLLASCAAQPSHAQYYTPPPSYAEVQYVETETGGTIQYHNRVTTGSPEVETYVFGDVVIQHVRRPNNESDTDIITVIGVPDGYVAVPYYLELNEGDYGEIEIIEWAGS